MLPLFLLFTLTLSNYVDLNLGRNDSYKEWCEIVLAPNHRGWSGFKERKEWTNVTVSIFPYMAKGFQLTAAKNNKNVKSLAYIPYYDYYTFRNVFQFLNFSISYSTDVFAIYLGLYQPLLLNYTFTQAKYSHFCDVSNLILGKL